MLPVFFPSGAPDRTLGKGKMYEIISCVVYEELNGDYSIEFEYPVTGVLYNDLVEGGVVAAVVPLESYGKQWKQLNQWFDIDKHSLPINGVVTFYGKHTSRRLSDVAFVDRVPSISSQYVATLSSDAYPQGAINGITWVADKYEAPSMTETVYVAPKSILAMMIGDEGSFVSTWGGEFLFDASIHNGAAGIRAIWYPNGRGADRGAEVRYGVNMLDIDSTRDWTGTFNAVAPYWKVSDVQYAFPASPIVQPTVPITPIKVAMLDCTDAFTSYPTDAQLVAYAQNWLDTNQPWISRDTITVDFVNGDEIDTHGAELYIGDTVHVHWDKADISAEMRVVSYKYDVLAERYAEITLGTQETEFVAVTGDSYAGATGGSSGGSDAYKPGDTLTLGAVIVSDGIITASTQVVRFMVVTPKSMAGITNITATNMSVELRGANGYLNSQSGFYDFADRSGYTVTCAKATDNLITVNITKSSAFTNVSNNTLVSANLNTTVAFEFS